MFSVYRPRAKTYTLAIPPTMVSNDLNAEQLKRETA